jgi:Uma2 family endonuclease
MAIAEQEKFVTEAELMALDEDDSVEIIDGEIVEMAPNGILHLFVGGNVYDVVKPFVVQNGLGYVFSDGLLCILDKRQRGIKGAQVPDVCFIRKGRIPKDFDISRPFPGAPDLAVEVVSPGDDVNKLLKRVRKYLEFGTEQVWVIYPEIREVHQYRRGSDMIQVYKDAEQMDVEALFPGLVLTLEEIFKLPELG